MIHKNITLLYVTIITLQDKIVPFLNNITLNLIWNAIFDLMSGIGNWSFSVFIFYSTRKFYINGMHFLQHLL